MMNKYGKMKKIKVAQHKQGNYLSLFLPRNIHRAVDKRRLSHIVINNSSGWNPTYKLLSEYGGLNRRLTGNKLMPFPGIIKAGPLTQQISLPEAYTMSQASEVDICYCKTTCNTKSSRCYNLSKLCFSRVHRHNTWQYSNYRITPAKSDQVKLAKNMVFQFLVVESILMKVS